MKTTKPSARKAPTPSEATSVTPAVTPEPRVEKELEHLQADLAAVAKNQPRPKAKRKPAEKQSEPAPAQPESDGTPAALAVVENRHPITVAFERCLHQGLASQDIQDQWKEDLTNAVIQGAKKFVGFNNVIALRKALDINLGLSSIALLVRTDGKPDIEAWAEIIQTVEVTELIGETIANLKSLVYERAYLFTELFEPPPRETLLAIATARDPKRKNLWVGYDRFLQEKRSRKILHTTDQLARFLIECLLRKNAQTWLEVTMDDSTDAEPIIPLAEEIINTLILRYCVLKTGERIPDKINLSTDYIVRLRKDYEGSPQPWLTDARARFHQLLKLLSPDMKEHLLAKNWFDAHLHAGPPKPAKSARRKKPTSDDDLPTEFVDIAGISGIYCYDIYG